MKPYIKILLLSAITVFIAAGFMANHADGAERIQIEIEAGLAGKAQQGKAFPVTLKVTNPGDDFSGDLVLAIPDERGTVSRRVIPIEIAADTTKSVLFTVQGMEFNYFMRPTTNQNNIEPFRLYEGSWEDGKEVPINPNLKLTPAFLPPERTVIGVLSDQPDALNYFKLTSFMNGEPAEVLALKEKDLPDEARGLETLDVLVINDFTVASLPEDVQQALKEWTLRGGHLIIGSSPGIAQELGSLTDLFPFKVNGDTRIDSLEAIAEAGETSLNVNHFEVMTGKVDHGADVLYRNGKFPLVIRGGAGSGQVTQFSYDLGSPVFSKWEGNSHFWNQVIGQGGSSQMNAQLNDNRMVSDLGRISELFASVAGLPVSLLVLLFAGYLIILVPVLYFALKKRDKREWSWVVIPVVAIVASLTLFGFGAKDRLGKIETNLVSIVSVDQNGLGSGHGAGSMLSQSAGKYIVTVENNLQPYPVNLNNQVTFTEAPVVEEGADQTRVTFFDVAFWSPRSLGLTLPVQKYGTFETKLLYDGKTVTGDLTNKFPYDFTNLYLLSGQKRYELGAFKSGEKKEIAIKVDSIQPPFPNFNSVRPMSLAGDVKEERQRRMNELLSRSGHLLNASAPVLIGLTKDQVISVKVNGEPTSENHLHLFTQQANLTLPDDKSVQVSTELMSPDVKTVSGAVHQRNLNGKAEIFAEKGTYDFVYEIPGALKSQGFDIKELNIRLNRDMNNEYSIFNHQTDKFEELTGNNNITYEKDANQKYVSDGTITLRVIKGYERPDMAVPTVEVKGGTKP